MKPHDSTAHSCTMCMKPATDHCGKCKDAYYCSKECQQEDHPIHKLLCGSFSKFPPEARPTSNHFRVIFFPTEKPKPEFAWVPLVHDPWPLPSLPTSRQLTAVMLHHKANAYKLIGHDALPGARPIRENERLGKQFTDTLWVTYRDAFTYDGSTTCESVQSILKTKSGATREWKGPVVAYAHKGLPVYPYKFRDMDMSDFRHIADYFLNYKISTLHPATEAIAQGEGNHEVVKGVRINCTGDTNVCGMPKYQAVDVPLSHIVFSLHYVSDIAGRVGIATLAHKIEPDPKWVKDNAGKYLSQDCRWGNMNALNLHICLHPDGVCTGLAGNLRGMGGLNDLGSVVIVRKDKKPLLMEHVEALVEYCQNVVRPAMTQMNNPVERKKVLDGINPAAFASFWDAYRQKKGFNAPSPYAYA